MKNKFMIGSIIAISLILAGCNKVENKINKEVIVIDEDTKETVEKKKSLALNLKFQGYIEATNEIKTAADEYEIYYLLEDSVFRFTILEYREEPMQQFGVRNIVKTEMKKLNLNSRDEDLTAGEWTELEIDGVLLGPGMGDVRDRKIFKDNKVYRLLSDGSLEEIEIYSEVYTNHANTEYINPQITAIELEKNNGLGIIKTEENEYFEIKDYKNIEGLKESYYAIFEAEDNKVYVFYTKVIGEEYELVIGYIENNKFYNLFENEDFIINQDGMNLGSEYVIKSKNNILFSGRIENENGIWNYNLETKNLSLQLELEEGTITTSMMLSPTKENLIIQNNSTEKGSNDNLRIVNNSLARLNEDLEIEEIIDITEKDKEIQFDKFSSDGKKLYLQYFNEEENRRIFEIYEITN